jgi:hypothetical protein
MYGKSSWYGIFCKRPSEWIMSQIDVIPKFSTFLPIELAKSLTL